MVFKLLPLYLLIVAGFVAGRALGVRKEVLARLLIYMLLPAVVFHAVTKANLTLEELSLPVVFFCLCTFSAWVAFSLARLKWDAPAPHILAFAGGTANSGYFGIPVGIALFGEQALSLIVLCSFGFTIFENTVGFYLTARGTHSIRESLRKVARLPVVPAFALGVVFNYSGFVLNPGVSELLVSVRGAYSVLGMMMIGLGLADLNSWRIDAAFTAFACAIKFLLWPLMLFSLLSVSGSWFDVEMRTIMFFMSALPIAANTVAVASLMHTEPEKAAVAVLITTLIALGTIPLILFLASSTGLI